MSEVEKKQYDVKNSAVAEAISSVKDRFAYLRDHTAELSKKELLLLMRSIGCTPYKENIPDFEAWFKEGKWKDELYKRLDFLATAPVEFRVNEYPDQAAKDDFGGVGILVTESDPTKSTGSIEPSRAGVITLTFDKELEKLEPKYLAKIMAHEFGHVWQPEAYDVLRSSNELSFTTNIFGYGGGAAGLLCAAIVYSNPITLGVAGAFAVTTMGVNYACGLLKNYVQQHSEYDADSFADLVVPEVRWRDTFKAYVNNALPDWNFGDGILTRTQAWAQSMYNMITLSDPHPSITERILSSERAKPRTNWVEAVVNRRDAAKSDPAPTLAV